jgi:hypothetical protein
MNGLRKNTTKIDALRDSNFNSDESGGESKLKYLEERTMKNNQGKHSANMVVNNKIVK